MTSFLTNYITPPTFGTHQWMSLNATDVLASRGQILMYARTDQTPASTNHFKSETGLDLEWVDKNGHETVLANGSNPALVKNWFYGYPTPGIPQSIAITYPNETLITNPAVAGNNFHLFTLLPDKTIRYNGTNDYVFSFICQGCFKLTLGAGTLKNILFIIFRNGAPIGYVKVGALDDGVTFHPFCLSISTSLQKNDIIQLNTTSNEVCTVEIDGLYFQINQISP